MFTLLLMNMANRSSETLGHEDRRQQVIEQLSEHYANGILEVEEFERRVEQAQKADNSIELAQLLQDLDPQQEHVEERECDQITLPLRSSDVPIRRVLLSFMGKVRRGKGWRVPRRLRIFTVMGGVELDLREAVFGPGVTELRIAAMMGGVRIIVPPGLPVEVEGSGVMGGFHDYRDPSQRAEGAPAVLKVTGVAMMGGVKIQVRLPGETPHDAARRMRLERRNRRCLPRPHQRVQAQLS